MWRNHPAVSKFASKFVYDLMPAAIASVIGGLLFTHYGLAPAAAPPAATQTVASAEMVQMVRDEHALIVDYLKQDAAAKRAAQLAADAELARHKARATELAADHAVALAKKAAALAAAANAPILAPTLAPKKSAVKEPVKELAREPVKQAMAPPLQLAAMMNPAPVAPPVQRGNLVTEKMRQMVATVERIPDWVREAANWVAELPEKTLPKSPARMNLHASL